MTPPKDFTKFSGKWKPSARKGSLYLLVAGMLAGAPACSEKKEDPYSYETVTTYQPTQGVITEIEEISPGEFAIVNETVVPSVDDSRFIIRSLDGSQDTLTMEQSRGLIANSDTVRTAIHSRPGHSLGSVLWWGVGGYMLGRSMSQPTMPYAYRDVNSQNRSGSAAAAVRSTGRTVQTTRPVPGGRSGFFGGSRGRASS